MNARTGSLWSAIVLILVLGQPIATADETLPLPDIPALVAQIGGPAVFSVTGTVRHVAFSPDGKHFAVLKGRDLPRGSLQLRSVDNGSLVWEQFCEVQLYDELRFTRDGRRILTANGSWEVATGQLTPIQAKTGTVIAVSDDATLAVVAEQERLVLYDVKQNSPRAQLVLGQITKELAPIGEGDSLERLFGTADEPSQRILPHWFNVAFLPENQLALSFGSSFAVFSTADGRQVYQRDKLTKVRCPSLAVSHDGKSLAVGTAWEGVSLFDVQTGRSIGVFRDPKDTLDPQCIAFSDDGKLLVAGSKYRNWLYVWDRTTGKLLKKRDLGMPVLAVAFSPDGRKLVVGGQSDNSRSLYVWDLPSWQELYDVEGPKVPFTELCYPPAGRHIVAKTSDGQVYFYNTGDHRRSGPIQMAGTLHVAPDGWVLADVDSSRRFTLRVAHTGEVLMRRPLLDNPRDGFFRLFNSTLSRCIFTSDYAGLHVMDVANGVVTSFPREPTSSSERIAAIDLSPDETLLAISLENVPGQTIEVWDMETRTLVRKLIVPNLPPPKERATAAAARGVIVCYAPDRYTDVKFLSDKRRLVAKRQNGYSDYWDVEEGKRYQSVRRVIGQLLPDRKFAIEKDTNNWESFQLVELATGNVCWKQDPIFIRKDLSSIQGIAEGRSGQLRFGAMAPAPDFRTLAINIFPGSQICLWSLAPQKLIRPQRGRTLISDESEVIWQQLGSEDAAKGYEAMWQIVAFEDEGVRMVRERLKPAVAQPLDMMAVKRHIQALGHSNFQIREKASDDLGSMGSGIKPIVTQALEHESDLEIRTRLEAIVTQIEYLKYHADATTLQQLRAVSALERVGTPAARLLLEELARGVAEASLTRDAKNSLDRLSLRYSPSRN